MSCSRVYVGRLESDVCEEDLERYFEGCGKINSILIKRGYAFVEFSDPLDADDAVFCSKGKLLNGKRINLELARGHPRNGPRFGGPSRRQHSWVDKYGPIVRTEFQLIVENLSSRISWQDLKDLMRTSGSEVTYANAHTDRRNVGHVEFASYGDMMKAYDKWNNVEIQGRRISLIINDNPHHRRRRSRSRSSHDRYRGRTRRSYSRSHSRSRSGSRRRSFSRSPSVRSYHSRSRSRSRDEKSVSKSRQLRERSRSFSRGRSGDRERSRSRSLDGRSRSRSIDLYESRSQSPENRQ